MTYPSPAVEISRRLFLVVGIMAAAWLGWLTDLRPYVDVSRPEHRPTAVASGSSSAEEEPDALVAESREPEQKPMLTVSGPAWEAFFFRVDQTFSKNLPVTGWEHRITSADLKQARKENARRAAMTEYQRQEELRVGPARQGEVRYRHDVHRELPSALLPARRAALRHPPRRQRYLHPGARWQARAAASSHAAGGP